MFTKENIKHMRAALALAKKGKGKVFPNPMVGCVIVKNGRVLSSGYHAIFGSAHAEAAALAAAGKRAAGADLYVTLEPCSTSSKRPPCAAAIIAAKIKRVFIAMADPNKQNFMKGIAMLKAADIEVHTGLLEKEARALNKDFIFHITKKQPRVAVKFAMSLDGKIATKNFDSKWITSARSREFVHKLRTKFDGILVGHNTARHDNPSLTSHGHGKDPVRIVVDEKLTLPARHNVLDGKTPTVVVCSDKIKTVGAHFKREGVTLLKLNFPAFKKDFKILISALNSYGIKTLLIEGGGETISSALNARAVNDVYAFIAPILVGGRNAVTPVEGAGAAKIKDALLLKKMKIKKIAGDILVTGEL